MKAFKIVPSIAEYMDFRTLAKELNLGERDLILTNEYIYNPTIAALPLVEQCVRFISFSGKVWRR